MARGVQDEEYDISAMEMTKWFNTNYHYIVPEFSPDQSFKCLSSKIFDEFEQAKSIGVVTKPVLVGPVSFLLLGKEKDDSGEFHRLDLRSEEHTSELQSRGHLVCRLLLEKKKYNKINYMS